MKIIHIEHSSVYVEMENYQLLFDYVKGDTPFLKKDKPLIIFASHRHPDHFHKDIFSISNWVDDVTYVLSDDIVTKENKNQVWMAPHQVSYLFDRDIRIETLKSTDEGVAFLVWLEGKEIYFAGDLHWWHWIGEEDTFNQNMEKSFKEEMRRIKDRHIEVAFIPLDPRQEEASIWGMDYMMRNLSIRNVFPIHQWKEYAYTKRWLEEEITYPYRKKIIPIQHSMEEFYV